MDELHQSGHETHHWTSVCGLQLDQCCWFVDGFFCFQQALSEKAHVCWKHRWLVQAVQWTPDTIPKEYLLVCPPLHRFLVGSTWHGSTGSAVHVVRLHQV